MNSTEKKYPRYLRVGITDRCNLKCSFCPRDEYFEQIGNEGVFMPLEKFFSLLRPIQEAKVVSLTGYGEPTLHPGLEQILNFICANSKSSRPISMISNATGFTERKVQMIRDRISSMAFSLNAATPETLKRMMGFDFAKMMEKLKLFSDNISEEDRARVALHCVTDIQNIDEMPLFVELAAKLRFGRVRFDEYRVIREQDFDKSLLHAHDRYNTKLCEAREVGVRLGVTVVGKEFFSEPERIFAGELYCKSPFLEAAIDTYGNVAPCCYTGQSLGNAFDLGFEAVWFGEMYERLRAKRFLGACKNCGIFHRLEEAHHHVGATLKVLPSIEPEVERWEQWRQSTASKVDAGRRQLDLRLYEYSADKLGSPFAERFGELTQAGLMTDFSRHYFTDKLPGTDPEAPWRELDKNFVESMSNQSISLDFQGALVQMNQPFIGGGWFVDRAAMDKGLRYIEPGWGAKIYINLPASNVSLQLLIHGNPPSEALKSLRLTSQGIAVGDMRVEAKGNDTLASWDVEGAGKVACLEFVNGAAADSAIAVINIRV